MLSVKSLGFDFMDEPIDEFDVVFKIHFPRFEIFLLIFDAVWYFDCFLLLQIDIHFGQVDFSLFIQ